MPMTPQDRSRLGGLSHSREHMRRLSRLSPHPGRPPFPSYREMSADPRWRKTLREIQREFGGGAPSA